MSKEPASAAALPDLASVVRAQLAHVVAAPRRGVWIALLLVLSQLVSIASFGVIWGVHVRSGDEQVEEPVRFFSSISELADEVSFAFDEGTVALGVAFLGLLAWGLFWPYRVWRGELPSRRGYHWAMPVDRRLHDLVRVAAGAVWLLAIILFLVAAVVATAALFGNASGLSSLPFSIWLNVLAAPFLPYLLVSVGTVRSEHPAAWLWGTLGSLFALLTVATALDLEPAERFLQGLVVGRFGLGTALAGPVRELVGQELSAGRWLLAWGLWTALAVAGLSAAASSRSRRL